MSRYATPKDLIPEPYCVLGTMLRPFSLGHHLLFTRLDLGFADDPNFIPKPDELAIAVFICASSPIEGEESIQRGEWEDEFKRWTRLLKPKNLWHPNRFVHQKEADKFSDYLEAGYSRPPIWRHETYNSVTLSAPWECLLKCRLVSGGFNESDVLEKYLPASWYEYFTLLEIEQAAKCEQPKNWRKIFITQKDRQMLGQAN